MGYNTRLQGSGASPSPFMGYGRPQQPMAPQPMGQQGQLAMPPRPGMSTYSTPGAAMPGQLGQQPMMNGQQSNPNQLANALSRM